MVRKVLAGAAASAVLVGVLVASAPASAATTSLTLPASAAFSILGHSCGGIQKHAFATGFDPNSGFPTGDVYMSTTCSGGGRGSHPSTYTAWAGVTWDFTGAVVSDAALSGAPSVNPTFSAFDASGNEIYNQSNNAYLVLAPGFVPAPRLIGGSVSAGPASGGTGVTITGTGFSGATEVSFGGTAAASMTIQGDTSISVVSPVHAAGTVDIVVTSAGGSSAQSTRDQFTFVAEPIVTSISPNSGTVSGGTTVTITGVNFTAATAVSVGDQQVGFAVVSDTEITLITPVAEGGPDSAGIRVSSLGGTSPQSSADQFTYTAVPVPTVTVSPSSGRPGTKITVTGTDFIASGTVKVTYETRLAKPHPASVTLCSVKATTSGTFSCKATVAKATAGAVGTHTITATQTSSAIVATSTFSVT